MLKKGNSSKKRSKFNGKFVFFATHNINKFNEARLILAEYDISVGMLRVEKSELQHDSLKEIAQISALEIFQKYGLPILLEDSGLFIEVLNGFPGPYAAYVYKTIGNNGILALIENKNNRTATFKTSIVYCNGKNDLHHFEGEVTGKITNKNLRDQTILGFGFDPIFQPKGNSKVFAEMSIVEKNLYSHRSRAMHKFARWFKHREK